MKRFLTIAAAACMLFVFSGQSIAGTINHDLKISGEYELDYVFDDTSFEDEDDNEETYLEHELDIKFKLGIGDNVTIGGKMEYADSTLGEDDHALGKDNDIDVEAAYIKAKFEKVTFTGGKFSIAFPCAFDGSPILDDEATGVDFDFGMFSVGMLRAKDYEADKDIDDKNDIFYVMGEVKTGNITISPYIAYQAQGENKSVYSQGDVIPPGKKAGDYTGKDEYDSFWVGSALEMEAGSIKIIGDLIYGNKSYSDSSMEKNDTSGIFLDVAAEMDMGSLTPTAFLIYSTGNDDDDDEKETIPVISADYEPLNIIGDAYDDITFTNGIMGIGVGVKGFSFLPKLEHDIIVFYAMGTNDEKSGEDFTTEDSILEIDFNSCYKLMEDFKIYADLGYGTIDLDEDTHGKIDDEGALYFEFGIEVDF